MAYYTLHAYDADVRIPEFVGLKQDDEIASDLRFAMEAENVETHDGVLQPQAGMTYMKGEFEDKVETIARFHRRWYQGPGTNEWLVCMAGGEIYCRQVDDNIGWVKIARPQSAGQFQSNVWSWVTYEQNVEGVDHPIDVLIISNNLDGMYMVVPPDRPTIWGDLVEYTWGELKTKTWADVYSEKWNVSKVTTTIDDVDYRFGVIERFKERLWGADIITYTEEEVESETVTKSVKEPDLLMYSTVYDPTDWRPYDPEGDDAPDAEHPRAEEDCAGDIRQPTWDGDSFKALKAFGDQLIAFKETHVWRVMGVGPSDFEFVQQYGGGTVFPNTVCVDVERILMVEKDGISSYDGMTVSPFNRAFIEQFWRTINRDAMDQMCAGIYKHRYYLAVPTGKSETNNALLIFDMIRGTFLVYTDTFIESLMPAGDILYATTSTEPGRVYEINYNSWETGVSSGKHAKWETPWMDFNFKTIAKGGYEIYFNPEVKGTPVTFRFSIQTEKKTKTKDVTISPTTFKAKQKRIRFGGTSRKFKLIIEVLPHAQRAVWRLTGGIHMVVETDPD